MVVRHFGREFLDITSPELMLAGKGCEKIFLAKPVHVNCPLNRPPVAVDGQTVIGFLDAWDHINVELRCGGFVQCEFSLT